MFQDLGNVKKAIDDWELGMKHVQDQDFVDFAFGYNVPLLIRKLDAIINSNASTEAVRRAQLLRQFFSSKIAPTSSSPSSSSSSSS